MTLIEFALALAAIAALAGAAAGALAPLRVRPVCVGGATALTGLGGLLAGAAALTGRQWSARWPGILPFGETVLRVDALSGAFLVIVGAVAIAAGVYSIGYTAPGGRHVTDTEHIDNNADHHVGTGAASRTAQLTLPLFVAAMLAVPLADSVSTLLLAWELMALTSLVLVLAEHRLRRSVGEAGLWYAAMTHAGFAVILGALAVFAGQAGDETFAALRAHADAMSPETRSLIFVLALIGFGSKAGAVPLHVWLPRAHPEAPSHVSALMSAAMVKLGIYGLIRVWFDLLGGGPRWWGAVVLAVGALSALYGVLQASVCPDLKKLLGYSTTENIGLILVGLGAAGILAAEGNRPVAGLLVAAAVLHCVNHATFKTLLFLGAGSVLRATGERNLDRLGGLAARMPATTALVAVGAFAAASLPPSNGFVSEWLLLRGLIHSFEGGTPTVLVAVAMPLAVAVVALTAGLAVVTFVKVFGVGFLARPRSGAADTATESPLAMHFGMGLAAAGSVTLGVLAVGASHPLTRVVDVLPSVRAGAPLRRDGIGLELAGISGSMSPLVVLIGLVMAAVVTAAGARALGRRHVRRPAPLWACGGAPPSARMEYTATSFAEPLTRVFDDVLGPETDIRITPHAESRYLIESAQYRQRVTDRIEARLYPPLLTGARRWGELARSLVNGSVHRYLALGFLGLLGVLVIVGFSA
jgi:formate hydrogenlyase subunit 3/multisubunit Na+/H+ antiporter MnhD subunit